MVARAIPSPLPRRYALSRAAHADDQKSPSVSDQVLRFVVVDFDSINTRLRRADDAVQQRSARDAHHG